MERNEILRKIEILFYQQNFHNVSMQDIANSLEIKKASLYYHFPSKENIIEEVLEYSFQNYVQFVHDIINKWNEHNFLILLKDFLTYWENYQNLFSIINQNGYEENDTIFQHIQEKQKYIFEIISKAMSEKANFSEEKTYLFLTLIHQVWKKKSSYWLCSFNEEKILSEIEKLFFNI